jgi:hypothetical protein
VKKTRVNRRSPCRLGTNHVALRRRHHEEAGNYLESKRRSPVSTERRNKEPRTEFVSRHDGSALNVHELVRNDNPSIQEGKEAPGHSTAHQ